MRTPPTPPLASTAAQVGTLGNPFIENDHYHLHKTSYVVAMDVHSGKQGPGNLLFKSFGLQIKWRDVENDSGNAPAEVVVSVDTEHEGQHEHMSSRPSSSDSLLQARLWT